MKQETPERAKLKPVIFFGSRVTSRHRQNTFQQVLLLRALAVTQDPKELAKITGIKTVAEVYRTLDKMMIRREFHDALARQGISLDFLVGGIKDIATGPGKDADRLNAFKALLKSLGLDQYKETSIAGGAGWEEALLQKKNEQEKLGEGDMSEVYDVEIPALPDSVRKSHDEEAEMLKGMYD